ncbi:MAG: S1 family peptidase [Bdellovibrio sp.]
MNKLLLGLLPLVMYGCSPLPVSSDRNPAMIGGYTEKPGSELASQVVALRAKDTKKVFCSGSIIGTNVILTAAHCVYDSGAAAKPGNLEVVFGVDARNPEAPARTVGKIFIHENYYKFSSLNLCPYEPCDQPIMNSLSNSTSTDNDLALLLLNGPIPRGARAVLLPGKEERLEAASSWHSSGYGLNRPVAELTESSNIAEDGYSGILMTRQTKVVRKIGDVDVQVKFGKILAESTSVGSSCFGDSGGPIFAEIGGRKIQMGVASHLAGIKSSLPCRAISTAYIDISRYVNWIEESKAKILSQTIYAANYLGNANPPGDILEIEELESSAPSWLFAQLKEVMFRCESAQDKLTVNWFITGFKDPQFSRIPEGSGVAALTTKGGRTFKIAATKKNASVGLTRNINITEDELKSIWLKTRDIFALRRALLRNNKGQVFIGNENEYISVNGQDQGDAFKIVAATPQKIVLSSENSSFELVDLRPLKKGKDGKTVVEGKGTCIVEVVYR